MVSLKTKVETSIPSATKDFNTADPCGYKSYYRNKGPGWFMEAREEVADPCCLMVV